MNRCVIVGGADIADYDAINSKLCENDFAVYCDCGLKHLNRLKPSPSLIVGDFDSYEKPKTSVETIVLPCEKDDTDTLYAVKEALNRGYSEFVLVGVIGARLDHTLGNVYILEYLLGKGAHGIIIDDHSEMELVGETPVFIGGEYAYFSLINITGKANSITVKNAKYPLDNARIDCGYQYGISNEVLCGKTACVSVKDGKLLLIKIRK